MQSVEVVADEGFAQAATTARAGLRGSIEAVVDHIATHPQHALAGLETWNQP